MTNRLNPRGYTWQKYLRTVWWRMALIAGLILAFWVGTTREFSWYLQIMIACIFINILWNHAGRRIWQDWQSR
jgi:1,4-dihydroxy-2-naphthoate octaprenyltransferase